MRAYVFWHRPKPGTDPRRYVGGVVRFHEALAGEPPAGLLGSVSHQVERIPWLAGAPGFEDGCSLECSTALDEAAVSGSRQRFHDEAAPLAFDGAAALYRAVLAGRPRPAEDSAGVWLSKPAGTGYAEALSRLQACIPTGAFSWRRQMVLAPSPEYCVELGHEDPGSLGLSGKWNCRRAAKTRLAAGRDFRRWAGSPDAKAQPVRQPGT